MANNEKIYIQYTGKLKGGIVGGDIYQHAEFLDELEKLMGEYKVHSVNLDIPEVERIELVNC